MRLKGKNLFRKLPQASFGTSSIHYASNTIFITLTYYLDLRNFNNKQIYYLYKRLRSTSLSLKQILGTSVYFRDFNYFTNLFVPIFFFSKKKYYFFTKYSTLFMLINFASQKKKNPKSLDFSFLLLSFKALSGAYYFFVKVLKRFSKNKFFFRVLHVFYSSFVSKKVDIQILLNSVVSEVKNMRKQHNKFFSFIFFLFKLFYKIFHEKKSIINIKFRAKGRLIPFNREQQRATAKSLRLGKKTGSDSLFFTKSFSVNEPTRFGMVGFYIEVSYKSPLYSSFSYSNNKIFSSFSYISLLFSTRSLIFLKNNFFFFNGYSINRSYFINNPFFFFLFKIYFKFFDCKFNFFFF